MLGRVALLAILIAAPVAAQTQPVGAPLVLEAKIPLGAVKGRIDHLAVDLKRRRLYVAELGNDSLGVVDLQAGRVLRTITGLKEPQGVGYEPTTDTIYVANAGDGSVRLYAGEDLAPQGRIDLGDDADNVRIDPERRQVLVGYGKGGLALIDPASRAKAGEVRLAGHPESFQLAEGGAQIFVNIPDVREIAVVERASGAVKTIATDGLRANFPMAVDAAAHRVLVVFRSPPSLLWLTSPEGRLGARQPVCGDADDIFVDAKRRRVYISCGEGVVQIAEEGPEGYAGMTQIKTVSGARTSLFVPELDRLYLAVRARGGEPAAIWVLRAAP